METQCDFEGVRKKCDTVEKPGAKSMRLDLTVIPLSKLYTSAKSDIEPD